MEDIRTVAARACLEGAYTATMDFPTIVGTLIGAGFEGYAIDYRRRTAIYYGNDGGSVELPIPPDAVSVAPDFSAESIQAAIREAQSGAPTYTYVGFCEKVKAAGCAGYMVSFSGRRVIYYGRTAELHVEHFPDR
jgi:uncharacterized protein YbcV (DUF1398 family)